MTEHTNEETQDQVLWKSEYLLLWSESYQFDILTYLQHQLMCHQMSPKIGQWHEVEFHKGWSKIYLNRLFVGQGWVEIGRDCVEAD